MASIQGGPAHWSIYIGPVHAEGRAYDHAGYSDGDTWGPNGEQELNYSYGSTPLASDVQSVVCRGLAPARLLV